MNESGEWRRNDKAARSTRTEIRQPICTIARGALSLRERLKHIVKKRVRSGRHRHCEELLRRSNPAFLVALDCFVASLLAMTGLNLQHRQAARLGAARKCLVERGQFVLAQRQLAGRGVVGGVLH
jgi:hypothetical protein